MGYENLISKFTLSLHTNFNPRAKTSGKKGCYFCMLIQSLFHVCQFMEVFPRDIKHEF